MKYLIHRMTQLFGLKICEGNLLKGGATSESGKVA